MFAACLFLLASTPYSITRDPYGVPVISAESAAAAYYAAGYSVAEDRLWQMEMSRRVATGRMSEILGKAYVAADTEILKTGYTNQELDKQFNSLSPASQAAFANYAHGVNGYIEKAKSDNKLPEGYAQNGFEPTPWTTTDSIAISIRLFRMFGRGGAGEIRDLALLKYLQSRKETKDRALDVVNDLAWFDDPRALTTVLPEDDKVLTRPSFEKPTRKVTEDHLALLPNVGLLDLLPGIRLASNDESKLIAATHSVPYKVGSYAIVVSPSRSTTGRGFLLNGPQMGFQNPSIVHEMTISYPGFAVAGMDVPGVPGVVIGYTRALAWGLTSGVADTDDIFFVKARDGGTTYEWGNQKRPIELIEHSLRIKGEADQKVVRTSTALGPVIINSGGTLFCQRMSYYGREMDSYEALMAMQKASTLDQVSLALRKATMSFNAFVSTSKGETGYFYLGAIPVRAPGIDPRFPTPGEPKFDWQGFVPYESMPKSLNPKQGLIYNWNNKPVSWWANSDTPVWGQIFRNELIRDNLPKGKISVADAEQAIFQIARSDETAKYFMPLIRKNLKSSHEAARFLLAYDGRTVAGSQAASIYPAFLDCLREQVFLGMTGNFMSMDTFRTVTQPSLILRALNKETKVDYLAGRPVSQVINAAFDQACTRLKARGDDPTDWRFTPGGIRALNEVPIPYSNRGTYIQIIETGPTIRGRNVLPPGVAESGPHSSDQIPLSRAWSYKPMPILGPGLE